MFGFEEDDEWRVKNQHSTVDEIDNRQTMELTVLLDKWGAGEFLPWDVLLQTSYTVGATHSLPHDFRYYRNCETAEGARKHVIQAHREANMYGGFRGDDDPQAIADAVWSLRQKYQAALVEFKCELRPEVLQEEILPIVRENIRAIRTRLENGEFDSWSAAIAIGQVILVESKLRFDDEDNRHHHDTINELRKDVERNKKRVNGQQKDISETLKAFAPETEEDIKRPLARLFAKRRLREEAYAQWVKEEEAKYEAEHGVSLQQLRDEEKTRKDTAHEAHMSKYGEWAEAQQAKGMVLNRFSRVFYGLEFKDEGTKNEHLRYIDIDTSRTMFSFYGEEEEIDENIEFKQPIDFPDRKLCKEIEISPSGTGLIQIHDKDPDHNWTPTDLGRITTYSVSFVPSDPADLGLLKDTLQTALGVLGSVPHKYEQARYTSAGDEYRRVSSSSEGSNRSWGRTESNYIETKDGKASPSARFDLDDLWVLYYLIEPVMEPSAQVAHAMNAARFSEERGAILEPDDNDGFGGTEHVVGNQSGYLKKSKPETMLADAMRDSLVDFAIGNIDEAEFTVRITTLAQHTLTGSIVDPAGNFPTYDSMLSDARDDKGAVISYDAALIERTQDLLRCLLGEPKDSARPLYVALMATVNEIARPLKEQSRNETRRRQRAREESIYEKSREFHANSGDFRERISKLFDEMEFAKKLSNIVAENPGITDEDIGDRRKNAVAAPTQLVVASSAVETAIDGVHHAHVTAAYAAFTEQGADDDGYGYYHSYSGIYVTRTAGSPHVRKELPEALKPFCPQESYRPSLRLLLSNPRNAFD